MKKRVTTLIICLLTVSINAQDNTKKVKDYSNNVKTLDSIIGSLYDVISGERGEARDWALFKHLFKPDAKLIPSGKDKKGVYKVRYMKPDDYIKNSGKWLVDNGFFEKEIFRKVDAFGHIAQVFSTYEAYKSEGDEEPFMRGINSIQLFYDGLRWWIVNIFWTQETEDQPMPNIYLPKQ
ncbi:hypothetical protein [Hwangdonia lutea]|uniref:Nuclear transport factor 2 family protein n=1 Tax=Hwangdonia lutea TaxID=3075823 RepID=A0AA97EPF3_9FLAO|nr:hypothetical protein [Hwangdonia sp. SCSIO 19198]WOD44044.1 hypothetical protein RNZ46_02000 [Hwangdonia sp. SCSIO 19198]